jgi:hypothetical protein
MTRRRDELVKGDWTVCAVNVIAPRLVAIDAARYGCR